MDPQITLEFMMGLRRASDEPEVKEALAEIGHMMSILQRFGDVHSEDAAYRGIRRFALREAERLRAARRDVGPRHFTQRELGLLGNHPSGRALLARMAGGDESAIAPAADLLADINRVRAELGLS